MNNTKRAIRFPDLQRVDNTQISIFSERSISKTSNTFLKTFDALGSLTEYIVQKNRTNELSKQLNAQKRVLNAKIDNLKDQKEFEFEEYTKRLQTKLQFEKDSMKLEFEKLKQEASAKINDFSISFEENMKRSQVLCKIINQEAQFLESIEDYIDNLADSYSQRKEYVVYCEMQRKSLDLVDKYMAEMI